MARRSDQLALSLVVGAICALATASATTAIALVLEREPTPPPLVTRSPAPAPAPPVAQAPPNARNVLLLVWDTARADRMSLYGHHRPTTPQLDAWATDAAVWTRAISPSFWTVPAHASLFTGLAVRSHGCDAADPWLRDDRETLAEWLGAQGWATWGFTANPNIGPATNLAQGFDTLVGLDIPPWAERAQALAVARQLPEDASHARGPAWTGPRDDAVLGKDVGPLAAEALADFLREREDGRPFFAFVNLMEAHTRRTPTRASRVAVGLTPAEIASGLKTNADFDQLKRANRAEVTYTDAEVDAMRGVYDATLRDLDDATAAVFAALAAAGHADDTVVVLVSDHGDQIGEQGLYGHNWSVSEALVHVPLVIRAPGLPPGRRDAPVSTADVFGTIAALAGAPIPGASTLLAPRSPVVTQLTAPHGVRPGAPERAPDGTYLPHRRRFDALYDGAWKLTTSSAGETWLYDLATDPAESRDRAAEEPERVQAMAAALDAWRNQTPLPSDAPLPRAERQRRKEVQESANGESREPLRALGYVQ
jgi:arylsulfatase A-like enzyme